LFAAALTRVAREVPAVAAHHVDFGAYCQELSKNRARAFAGTPMRDPNLRAD
jgi:hypothetical protein